MSRAVRVTVEGQVQGVGFRAHVAQEAARVEVTGWVANEPDGSVAVHVEGSSEAVEDLLEQLRSGPPSARVDRVGVEEAEPEGSGRFEIRY